VVEGRNSVAGSGDFGDWIKEAAVALVFAIHSDGGLRPDFDIGRMAQNAMIVANSEGLSSCPMTVYRQQELRDALSIPDEYDVPMVVGMGFSANSSKTSRSHPRIPLEDMIYREIWQKPSK
jgi:nitroreductase